MAIDSEFSSHSELSPRTADKNGYRFLDDFWIEQREQKKKR